MFDDMVDDMTRHRSVIGLSSVHHCFITGRSMGYDMLHHLLVLNSLAGARSGKLNSTGVEGIMWGS
jgi:hypothetical protein